MYPDWSGNIWPNDAINKNSEHVFQNKLFNSYENDVFLDGTENKQTLKPTEKPNNEIQIFLAGGIYSSTPREARHNRFLQASSLRTFPL